MTYLLNKMYCFIVDAVLLAQPITFCIFPHLYHVVVQNCLLFVSVCAFFSLFLHHLFLRFVSHFIFYMSKVLYVLFFFCPMLHTCTLCCMHLSPEETLFRFNIYKVSSLYSANDNKDHLTLF